MATRLHFLLLSVKFNQFFQDFLTIYSLPLSSQDQIPSFGVTGCSLITYCHPISLQITSFPHTATEEAIKVRVHLVHFHLNLVVLFFLGPIPVLSFDSPFLLLREQMAFKITLWVSLQIIPLFSTIEFLLNLVYSWVVYPFSVEDYHLRHQTY